MTPVKPFFLTNEWFFIQSPSDAEPTPVVELWTAEKKVAPLQEELAHANEQWEEYRQLYLAQRENGRILKEENDKLKLELTLETNTSAAYFTRIAMLEEALKDIGYRHDSADKAALCEHFKELARAALKQEGE